MERIVTGTPVLIFSLFSYRFSTQLDRWFYLVSPPFNWSWKVLLSFGILYTNAQKLLPGNLFCFQRKIHLPTVNQTHTNTHPNCNTINIYVISSREFNSLLKQGADKITGRKTIEAVATTKYKARHNLEQFSKLFLITTAFFLGSFCIGFLKPLHEHLELWRT